MGPNTFEPKVRGDDVRSVRFLHCATSGIIRGKAVHLDNRVERLRGGIGLIVAMPVGRPHLSREGGGPRSPML